MRTRFLTFALPAPSSLTDEDQGQDHAPLSIADGGELSFVLGEFSGEKTLGEFSHFSVVKLSVEKTGGWIISLQRLHRRERERENATTSGQTRCHEALGGMTNYRIGRIGTHRHASTLNLTTSTRQNRGSGMGVNLAGNLGGR